MNIHSFASSLARSFAPVALAAATFCGTLGFSSVASADERGREVPAAHAERGDSRDVPGAHAERGDGRGADGRGARRDHRDHRPGERGRDHKGHQGRGHEHGGGQKGHGKGK